MHRPSTRARKLPSLLVLPSFIAVAILSSCRTTYKTESTHEQDSLAVSTLQRLERQRSDSISLVNLSNMERIAQHWTTWERYDTLGRVIERATSHSEERTHQQDSTHSTERTEQALERHDSTKTIRHSTRATHSTLERQPPALSLWHRWGWLALALALGAALGIYTYRRIRP